MAKAMACNKILSAAGLFVVALIASANASAQGAVYNYLLHCGGCHIEDGSGMPPQIPDLRIDMPFFASFAEGRAYMARVPGVVHAPMTDEQVTEVLNLILSRFAPDGSNLQPYSVEEVVLYQKELLADPKKLRDQLTAHRVNVTQVDADDNH